MLGFQTILSNSARCSGTLRAYRRHCIVLLRRGRSETDIIGAKNEVPNERTELRSADKNQPSPIPFTEAGPAINQAVERDEEGLADV